MALKIMPHGRLQEWVAEEKGYFTAEGLDYSFVISGDYGVSSVQPLGGEEALLFGDPFLQPAVRHDLQCHPMSSLRAC